ncbi:MAG: TetR/AcrR family transcriptional regulator [Cyclobacteriaceae bacterium]
MKEYFLRPNRLHYRALGLYKTVQGFVHHLFEMINTIDNRQKWISTGYGLFGELGPEALNVEKLSNIVGLNRSSFYHYFGDIESFESALFSHHIKQYEAFGEIIKDYDQFEQLFTQEVFDHKDALAFQRQLMINQGITRYKNCSDNARKFTEQKTFELWSVFNENKNESETEWTLFRALRDFYFIHHGQNTSLRDPKEVLMMLHQHLNKK